MANPLKGEVSFPVGEETMTLVYSINALIVLEDRLDMSVQQIGEKMGAGMRLGFLRAVFWAGLSEHHPTITEAMAGAVMQQVGPERVGELITEAFYKAFPSAQAKAGEGDAAAPGPRKRPRAGTGNASS